MTDFLTMIAAAQEAALQQYNVRQIGDVAGEPITIEEARAQCHVDLWGSPPESDDDFWLLNVGIPAARTYCENYKGTAFAQRTMELATNAFPSGAINLPFGPVQSITSIKYDDQDIADAAYTVAYAAAYAPAYTAAYDAEFLISSDVDLATAAGVAAGVASGVAAGDIAGAAALEQTLATTVYSLNVFPQPMTVILQHSQVWPAARDFANSVRIRYVVGISLPGDSPIVYTLPPTAKAGMLLMLGHLYANREAVNVGGAVTTMPLGVHAYLDLTPGGSRTDFA